MDKLTYFLKRRGLYKNFLYNIEHCSLAYKMFHDIYKTPMDRYDVIKELTNPMIEEFGYALTPDGSSFWLDIADEYIAFRKKKC